MNATATQENNASQLIFSFTAEPTKEQKRLALEFARSREGAFVNRGAKLRNYSSGSSITDFISLGQMTAIEVIEKCNGCRKCDPRVCAKFSHLFWAQYARECKALCDIPAQRSVCKGNSSPSPVRVEEYRECGTDDDCRTTRVSAPATQLDRLMEDEEDEEKLLAQEAAEEAAEKQTAADRKEKLDMIFSLMTPRQRTAWKMVIGYEDGKRKTHQEVAIKLGSKTRQAVTMLMKKGKARVIRQLSQKKQVLPGLIQAAQALQEQMAA